MLGKTNINTLSEGAVVTEVEDFSWVLMQSGTYNNFFKAIYQNGYLAAITANGTIAYSTDGEVWDLSTLDEEYEECKLNDIIWDGKRFILVGCCKDPSDETHTSGMILTTTDFETFERINLEGENKLGNENNKTVVDCCAIFKENEKYTIIINYLENQTKKYGLEITDFKEVEIKYISNTQPSEYKSAQNDNMMLVVIDKNGLSKVRDFKCTSDNDYRGQKIVFECKNNLYYTNIYSNSSQGLIKVPQYSNETDLELTNQPFKFVDGEYYAEREIFINNNSLLVVKKGENISEKTVDDLIEIAPEYTINCIKKAFNNLYIFGNRGVILKSSAETGNEETITVQVISAKKALAEANAYTNEKIAELDSRIKQLESQFN